MLIAMHALARRSTVGSPSTGTKIGPAAKGKIDTGNPTAGNTANAAKNHPAPSPRTPSMPVVTASLTRPHTSAGNIITPIAVATASRPPAVKMASRRLR